MLGRALALGISLALLGAGASFLPVLPLQDSKNTELEQFNNAAIQPIAFPEVEFEIEHFYVQEADPIVTVPTLEEAAGNTEGVFTNTITIGSTNYSIENGANRRVTDFGGPTDDFGIRESLRIGGSGLAYSSVTRANHPELFLPDNHPSLLAAKATYGTTNDFMALNEDAYYVATRSRAPGAIVIVENPETGQWVTAVNVDFGPGDPTAVDTSDGVRNALGLEDGRSANIYFAEDQTLAPGTTGVGGAVIDTPDDDDDQQPPTTGTGDGETGSGGQSGGASNSGSGGSSGTLACGGGPWCSIPRYCYKYGGAPGPKGLHEGVKTCNSGYKWIDRKKGLAVFRKDCGVKGVACDKSATLVKGGPRFACLSQVCKTKNAIWDMDSLKCGCDDGTFTGAGDSGDTSGDTTPPTGEEPQTPPRETPDEEVLNEADGVSSGEETKPAPELEENPEGTPGRIYDEAIAAIDNPIACEAPRSSSGSILGCAQAVSKIIERADIPVDSSLSTGVLNNNIKNSDLFDRVDSFADAKPGDIVVSPTVLHQPGSYGHTGIVIAPGGSAIASNSGLDGFFRNNYTAAEWESRFVDTRNLDLFIWRAK